MNFETNQIVKGINAGTFVVLGYREVGGSAGYQLKAVNPNDHTQVSTGEIWLPAYAIKPIAA